MLRNGFICRGRGELANIGRLESNIQLKGKKCSEKCLNIFVMQKCSDQEEHFYEHYFQSWNEIENTQQIAGWYKVYIQGISKPNEKQKMRAVSIALCSLPRE
jgi:hypothetical protein